MTSAMKLMTVVFVSGNDQVLATWTVLFKMLMEEERAQLGQLLLYMCTLVISQYVCGESANHEVSIAEHFLHCKIACALWMREYGWYNYTCALLMACMYLFLYTVELLLNYAAELKWERLAVAGNRTYDTSQCYATEL